VNVCLNDILIVFSASKFVFLFYYIFKFKNKKKIVLFFLEFSSLSSRFFALLKMVMDEGR